MAIWTHYNGTQLTTVELDRHRAYLSAVAKVEATTGKRVTTYQPGRGCFVALLDGVPVRGVYGSRQEAVEAVEA